MIELLNNPVTIIASLLSIFFIIMAVGRRMVKKRMESPLNQEKQDDRYTVVDPYDPVSDDPAQKKEPENPLPPESKSADPQLSSILPEETPHLKEYRPTNKPARLDSSENAGYVWE